MSSLRYNLNTSNPKPLTLIGQGAVERPVRSSSFCLPPRRSEACKQAGLVTLKDSKVEFNVMDSKKVKLVPVLLNKLQLSWLYISFYPLLMLKKEEYLLSE